MPYSKPFIFYLPFFHILFFSFFERPHLWRKFKERVFFDCKNNNILKKLERGR